MKVLVFSTHILWASHYETELEIMQQHLNAGDEIIQFVCNGHLGICDTNPRHELKTCLECRDKRVCGTRLLNGSKIKELPLIHPSAAVQQQVAAVYTEEYHSIETLQEIYVDGFDVGYATSSSVVSLLRVSDPDVATNKEMFNGFFKTALQVYFSALQYIKEQQPDMIYIFNGRFAHVKALLRAAQQMDITCYVHERGHGKNYYELFKNTTPHNRAYILSRMMEYWNKASVEERNRVGASFYEERVKGIDQAWFSFVKLQEAGRLPDNWDSNKRNIVIYNSSEDEFVSIGADWKNDLYNTQLEAIHKILADCLQYPELYFYLRIHPNLLKAAPEERVKLNSLNYPNLTIIDADSKVSSYDLLFNCEKVLAFGSSAGIEAVYWGKPSIQAGKSYYYDMDVTYKPQTHEEVIHLLLEHLQPMDKTGALIYGYYFKTFGIPFKDYQPLEFGKGTYKGVDLSNSKLFTTKLYDQLSVRSITRPLTEYVAKKYRTEKQKLTC